MKDDVLKEMHQGGSGLFVDACYLCEFFNVDYTSDSFLLERVNDFRGVGFKLSGEFCVACTFYQRCQAFIVGHSTQDVVVGALLPMSRSRSRWDFHFHSYVLRIYVRLY